MRTDCDKPYQNGKVVIIGVSSLFPGSKLVKTS
jgi:hypothetical protein